LPRSNAARAIMAWSGRQTTQRRHIAASQSRLVVKGRCGDVLPVELELQHVLQLKHRGKHRPARRIRSSMAD
jgi:hypothetical protein